jgi:hypothetical protein
VPDHRGERDVFWRPAQAITSSNAASAFHDSGGFQVVENLFEEALGNVLLGRDGLNPNDLRAVVFSQNKEGAQGVFTTRG